MIKEKLQYEVCIEKRRFDFFCDSESSLVERYNALIEIQRMIINDMKKSEETTKE